MNYSIIVNQLTRKSEQTPLAEEFAREIEATEGRQKMVVRLESSFPAPFAVAASTSDSNQKKPEPAAKTIEAASKKSQDAHKKREPEESKRDNNRRDESYSKRHDYQTNSKWIYLLSIS